MKEGFFAKLHSIGKHMLKPELIVKLILMCGLLVIHGYTDSVTDNRWALYNIDNLLCADTFVVTACLVVMGLVVWDYYFSLRSYISEVKMIRSQIIVDDNDDDLNILEQLQLGNSNQEISGEKIVSFSDYLRKSEDNNNNEK